MGFKAFIMNPRNWIFTVLIVCAIVFKIPALRYFVLLIIVTSLIFKFVGKYAAGVKTKADAKAAAINMGIAAGNTVIDYSNVGHVYGSELFCKFYPKYILVFNICLSGMSIACLYHKMYWQAILLFLILNVFIILNQIWRQLRRMQK